MENHFPHKLKYHFGEGLPMLLSLDRAGGVPLYLQLYRGLRDRMLDGSLPPGHRMPALRQRNQTQQRLQRKAADSDAGQSSNGPLPSLELA